MPSSIPLSTLLMKSWVVRVFGPAVAKEMRPRRFGWVTGSSGMRAPNQAWATAGSPWIPNWHMKPSMFRKQARSVKKPTFTRL